MRSAVLWSLVAGLGTVCWAGCSSTPAGGALFGAPNIGEIHVLTMPMALNLDEFPGADGFALKIYAIDPARPKSVDIVSGGLEILIYDGAVPAVALATNTPVDTWRFSASELSAFAQNTSVGVVYALTPTWRERKPSGEMITVTACYVAPGGKEDGRRICSRPTTVTVALPAGYK